MSDNPYQSPSSSFNRKSLTRDHLKQELLSLQGRRGRLWYFLVGLSIFLVSFGVILLMGLLVSLLFSISETVGNIAAIPMTIIYFGALAIITWSPKPQNPIQSSFQFLNVNTKLISSRIVPIVLHCLYLFLIFSSSLRSMSFRLFSSARNFSRFLAFLIRFKLSFFLWIFRTFSSSRFFK